MSDHEDDDIFSFQRNDSVYSSTYHGGFESEEDEEYSTLPKKTGKEQEKLIEQIQKENFDLKLKIYNEQQNTEKFKNTLVNYEQKLNDMQGQMDKYEQEKKMLQITIAKLRNETQELKKQNIELRAQLNKSEIQTPNSTHSNYTSSLNTRVNSAVSNNQDPTNFNKSTGPVESKDNDTSATPTISRTTNKDKILLSNIENADENLFINEKYFTNLHTNENVLDAQDKTLNSNNNSSYEAEQVAIQKSSKLKRNNTTRETTMTNSTFTGKHVNIINKDLPNLSQKEIDYAPNNDTNNPNSESHKKLFTKLKKKIKNPKK